jgi:hypothetical protein
MNSKEKIDISSQGAHQLALRRKSVKVFEGAIKVFTMRAPSEREAASGGGTGADTGDSGAAAMTFASCWN